MLDKINCISNAMPLQLLSAAKLYKTWTIKLKCYQLLAEVQHEISKHRILSVQRKGKEDMKDKIVQTEINTVFDADKKLWHCLDDDCQKSSPNAWIFNVLATHGSKIAQVFLGTLFWNHFLTEVIYEISNFSLQINHDTGVHLTFDEIRLRAIRIAQNLQKRGLQPRQTIGILAGNSDNLLSIFLASIFMACPIVPFHPTLSNDEIVRILNETKPQILFCDDSTFDNSKQIADEFKSNVKVFTFGTEIHGTESVSDLLRETGDEGKFVWVFLRSFVELGFSVQNFKNYLKNSEFWNAFLLSSPTEIDMANDLAGILCSSGTTGPSKCNFIKEQMRKNSEND